MFSSKFTTMEQQKYTLLFAACCVSMNELSKLRLFSERYVEYKHYGRYTVKSYRLNKMCCEAVARFFFLSVFLPLPYCKMGFLHDTILQYYPISRKKTKFYPQLFITFFKCFSHILFDFNFFSHILFDLNFFFFHILIDF